ncbi:Lactoylglutathione lyase / glyoxalase I family protein [Prunus dulcis]|uniref:Lactoylglutathione lyase / glyoxalase I family protein n=1 Tax=Prunus dulcis TaxID=3755 RepID=A0A4Y1RZS7_PRUDU|nr:Lactoylglutathione lyase / glyoxalase I family protein [Prunus dulcis]
MTQVRECCGSGAIALWLETPDIGAAVAKAVLAGAVSEGEITTGVFSDPEQPVGKVRDPFGFLCSSPARD